MRQPQHVTDLVHRHAQQEDAFRGVGADGLEVLLVVKVHVAGLLRVSDLASVAVKVVSAVLV